MLLSYMIWKMQKEYRSLLGRPKGSKTGSVFFNKSKGKWFCEYYVIDKDT